VLSDLADRGAGLLRQVVDDIAAGTARAVPQTGVPTLAPKLSLADGLLDFTAPAPAVLDRFRGTTPEPGAHTMVGGQRLKVLAARLGPDAALTPGRLELIDRDVVVGTSAGTLALDEVQPAGKGRMRAADWWRGLRVDALQVDDVRTEPAP